MAEGRRPEVTISRSTFLSLYEDFRARLAGVNPSPDQPFPGLPSPNPFASGPDAIRFCRHPKMVGIDVMSDENRYIASCIHFWPKVQERDALHGANIVVAAAGDAVVLRPDYGEGTA